MKTFKTGIRKLTAKKLKPYIERWRHEMVLKDAAAKPRSWNSLSRAMLQVPGGKGVNGADIQRLLKKGSYNMSAEAQFSLCVVLGVTWEEISEPLD